jgi:anaerobic magnesium-protoporphyrin IX monomethyl ester cyclase
VETVFPPLGLGYLAAVLKKKFPSIEVRIIDRDVEAAVKTFRPDAVSISAVSQNMGMANKAGEYCRSIGIPVFLGGVHITLLPGSLTKAFDFGVCGEAEETIMEIVDYLSGGGIPGSPDMENIEGLILHEGSGVKLTGMRSPIAALDTLPFPDRSLLNIPPGQTTYLFTSRGCPYTCTFCASTRFWNGVRWFSAEYVVNEIEHVVGAYKPWAISFYDDLFIGHRKRLMRIVDLLCAKNLNRKVKYSFACRADLVNEELIEILKPLNIQMICMGLESGCGRTLNYLKGERATVEQNHRAVELLTRAGINVQGTFIIGSPDETEEEILETLKFIKKSNLVNFEVYLLSPFPGTPIWETARERGLVGNEMDWKRLAVDSEGGFEDRITVSQLPRNRLVELYKLFSRERQKRRVKYIVKTGLKNPGWVLTKMREIAVKR